MTIKLKTSLSKTLTHFYPLAGKLSKNRNTIDCNDQGVQFLVVQVESNLLDIIKSPVIKELNQLAMVEASSVEEQLAIQINLFACGGIAVGISMSHRIMDACSLSSFVCHWFSAAKGSETSLMGPVLDSAVLFPPMESYEYSSTVHSPLKNTVTKRFVFSSLAINKLKREVVKNNCTLVNPTRVEVVTALIWKCATAALGDCKASVAFHIVNFRKKMVPALQDHQFGNLFQLAKSTAHPTADLASLVVTLKSSFGKINDNYMKSLTGENGVEIAKDNFREIKNSMIQEGVRVFKFSSWCGFSVNEGDFGWGKPLWISIVNLGDENSTVLVDSTCDDGIEAWIVMNKDNMKRFEQNVELKDLLVWPITQPHPSAHLAASS
uniref:stemmadenine O-acetyltransferase-like n=1 Tax=Erigeron canadensis TaxID=72917 RepID=UPI001CB9668E|nr:stemmadenine O-acetyltransferase-like [Erigeron canadensis]